MAAKRRSSARATAILDPLVSFERPCPPTASVVPGVPFVVRPYRAMFNFRPPRRDIAWRRVSPRADDAAIARQAPSAHLAVPPTPPVRRPRLAEEGEERRLRRWPPPPPPPSDAERFPRRLLARRRWRRWWACAVVRGIGVVGLISCTLALVGDAEDLVVVGRAQHPRTKDRRSSPWISAADGCDVRRRAAVGALSCSASPLALVR